MNISYHHSKQLAFSPAFTFVIEAFGQMLRSGVAHPCFDFGNQSEVVYALADEPKRVIGCHVFSVDGNGRCLSHIAFVHPNHRGAGIAGKMFDQLEKVLKGKLNIAVLYSSAVDENLEIHRVFEKTGRDRYTSRYVKWYKEVEQL